MTYTTKLLYSSQWNEEELGMESDGIPTKMDLILDFPCPLDPVCLSPHYLLPDKVIKYQLYTLLFSVSLTLLIRILWNLIPQTSSTPSSLLTRHLKMSED